MVIEIVEDKDIERNLEIAESIAKKAHKGQKRRDGKPYITHPQAVAESFDEKFNWECKTIAWLHDVLEDTDVTSEDLIKEGIFRFIVDSVEVLSRKEGENYKDFILRCSKDYYALRVKMADLKHNMSDLKEGSMKDKYRLAFCLLERINEEDRK